MRILSGIQPSGRIHLGNYFGAIQQHVRLQNEHECFYFIADYHALTSTRDAGGLRRASTDIALDYLALGLDPKKAVLYRQSDVPEVTELAWLLNCVTPVGLMQRAPAFKEKVDAGLSANMGLFSYPILMAADILLTSPDAVPVGKDQLPHIEMAQDIASAFNAAFKTSILKRPEPLLGPTPKVPGTDGRKMSKSYGNVIDVFGPMDIIKKQVMSIQTDSRPVHAPSVLGEDNASAILDLFLSPSERLEWRSAMAHVGVGYGSIKTSIIELHEREFKLAAERRAELAADPYEVKAVLAEGATRVRQLAVPLLNAVRFAVGLPSGVA